VSELGSQTVPDTSAPHLCLWNTAGFYALRGDAGERVQIDHAADDGRLVGSFVAGWDGDELVSGYSAPFGGPDIAREHETAANVVGLVRTAVEAADAHGAASVRVRLKPPHYGEVESLLQFVLLTTGFAADRFDLNYFVDLRPFADADGYESGLKAQSRRAIRHARELSLVTEVVDRADDDAWHAGYRVLEANRVSKGRPMRLPFDYVRSIRDAFPTVVRMLIMRTPEGTVCAAALLYRIARGHDVVQYWGDALHELPHSPMALLVRDVVEHALVTGAAFLDLGISTDHGVPNHGLIQFKRSIGAEAEVRLEIVGRVADLLDHPGWALVRA
jgi:predicted N-acyltransferase